MARDVTRRFFDASYLCSRSPFVVIGCPEDVEDGLARALACVIQNLIQRGTPTPPATLSRDSWRVSGPPFDNLSVLVFPTATTVG